MLETGDFKKKMKKIPVEGEVNGDEMVNTKKATLMVAAFTAPSRYLSPLYALYSPKESVKLA